MANEQKQQFNHTMHINAFLNAISAFDESLEKKHRNKLDSVLEKEVELDVHASVSNMDKIYKIVSSAYLSLYEEGIRDILAKLLNKSGSVTYTAKLLACYISALWLNVENKSVFYIDEKRLNQISYDKEYNDEFKALHLGLFSIMPFIYPGNNPENIKFVRVDIRPSYESSELDGLEFIFKFKCHYAHYANECHLKLQVNFSRLRKGVVVQAVQCLNNVAKYNEDIDCCKFIQIGNQKPEYSIDRVLKNLESSVL